MLHPQYRRNVRNQEANRTIEQFAPLINKYTYKFSQRARSLGTAMDEDDIRQELSIIFLRCVEAYDESKGGSFMNFLISAWFNEMNQLMRRDQRNFERGKTRSDHVESDDGDAMSIFDTVDSGWATPEQNLEALQQAEALLNALTPQARVLVHTLIDPPDAICEQYAAHTNGIRERRDAQLSAKKTYRQLTLRFLFEAFQVSPSDQVRITREIQTKAAVVFHLAG